MRYPPPPRGGQDRTGVRSFGPRDDQGAASDQAQSTHTPNPKNVQYSFIRPCRTNILAPSGLNGITEMLYDTNVEKTHLPNDEVEFLGSLPREEMESRLRALWEAGWSLQILGESLIPPRPKTTIHFWVKRATPTTQIRNIPPPPPKSLTTSVPTRIAPRMRTVSPGVPPAMRPRLRELSALARRYRANTPPSSPYAIANEQLTEMAKNLRMMGVPTADIAEAAGVSYRAMARRLSK